MASPKELTFHSDFLRATVLINGLPVSLNAEVSVSLKQPTKLDEPSRLAWKELSKSDQRYVTVELVPGAPNGG